MTKTKTYYNLRIPGSMHVSSTRYFIIFIYLLTILPGIRSFAQIQPEYDEISVFLDVPHLGGGEIEAVIKGEKIYLPVTDLFDFLKIRNTPSPGLDGITGFFITQEAAYRIDRLTNSIRFGEKVFDLEPGALIRTESNLYLRADYYGRIFGLDCIFNFRNLSVTINTNRQVPEVKYTIKAKDPAIVICSKIEIRFCPDKSTGFKIKYFFTKTDTVCEPVNTICSLLGNEKSGNAIQSGRRSIPYL